MLSLLPVVSSMNVTKQVCFFKLWYFVFNIVTITMVVVWYAFLFTYKIFSKYGRLVSLCTSSSPLMFGTDVFAQSCYKLAWVFCMHHFLGSHGFLPTSCTLKHQNHSLLHFQSLEDSLIAFGNMFYNFGWLIMLAMDCFQKLVTSCFIFLE